MVRNERVTNGPLGTMITQAEFAKTKVKVRKNKVSGIVPMTDEKEKNTRRNIFAAFCSIPLIELELADYQRGLSESHLNKMELDFQPRAVTPVVVSYRDERFFTVDGQHRSELMTRKDYKAIKAILQFGMSYEEEAQLFFILNDVVRKMTGWGKFKGLLNARNPVAKQLVGIARSYKLTVPMDPEVSRCKDADIKSPTYLLWPYDKGGLKLVKLVCKVLDECWREDKTRDTGVCSAAKDTALIRGLSVFLREHHQDFAGKKGLPWTTIKMVLKNMHPSQIRQVANKENATRTDSKQFQNAFCEIFGVDKEVTVPHCHLSKAA